MSTRDGVSAFGVIHKSEYEPGKFKPVTQMGPKKRSSVAVLADQRWTARRRRESLARSGMPAPGAGPKDRGLSATWAKHGYAMRNTNDEVRPDPVKSAKKMRREFDPSHHTPSAVHPNIQYGESVKPKARARLDRKLDPKLAGALKHPVVFHRDKKLTPVAHAAAVPAHVSTGGRGHVVLGHTFKGSGKWKNPMAGMDKEDLKLAGIKGGTERGVVNHELVHAGKKGKPVQIAPGRRFIRRALGEEGRADAVSGGHVYTRTGALPGKKTLKAQRKEIKTMKTDPGKYGLNPTDADHRAYVQSADNQVAGHGHYHKVKRLIRVGSKVR